MVQTNLHLYSHQVTTHHHLFMYPDQVKIDNIQLKQVKSRVFHIWNLNFFTILNRPYCGSYSGILYSRFVFWLKNSLLTIQKSPVSVLGILLTNIAETIRIIGTFPSPEDVIKRVYIHVNEIEKSTIIIKNLATTLWLSSWVQYWMQQSHKYFDHYLHIGHIITCAMVVQLKNCS